MVVIGIAGGSGSGKTTIANAIVNEVGASNISYVHHDAYYKDLAHLTYEERCSVNFDHPDSLDNEYIVRHVRELRDGKPVDVPIYDFTCHSRTNQTLRVEPRLVIIVEGILVFYEPELRKLFDVMIYVDTDPDIRLIRRMQRDINERHRSFNSVVEQYQKTVRPMHLEFVEPSKRHAHLIIPEGGYNSVGISMVASRIRDILNFGNSNGASNHHREANDHNSDPPS